MVEENKEFHDWKNKFLEMCDWILLIYGVRKGDKYPSIWKEILQEEKPYIANQKKILGKLKTHLDYYLNYKKTNELPLNKEFLRSLKVTIAYIEAELLVLKNKPGPLEFSPLLAYEVLRSLLYFGKNDLLYEFYKKKGELELVINKHYENIDFNFPYINPICSKNSYKSWHSRLMEDMYRIIFKDENGKSIKNWSKAKYKVKEKDQLTLRLQKEAITTVSDNWNNLIARILDKSLENKNNRQK